MNLVNGLPGILIETSNTTISSFPLSADIAPCKANGPISPGGYSFCVVSTNFSPNKKIFSIIDSFVVVQLISAVMQPFYDIFAIEGVELGFTSVYLLVINMFTGFLFGWYFVPFHLLMITSVVLLLQLTIWMFTTSQRLGGKS